MRGRREQAKRAGLLDGLAAPSVPGRDRRARHTSTRDLARRHATRLTAWQHAPAVVADRPPMDLRWTPDVPGLAANPDDLRRSGRASVLSCLRGTRQARGRYIAGGQASRATALCRDGRVRARRDGRQSRPLVSSSWCPVSVKLAGAVRVSSRYARLVENQGLMLSQLTWHLLAAAGADFAVPAEHPAHHVEDAKQGHVTRARLFAD